MLAQQCKIYSVPLNCILKMIRMVVSLLRMCYHSCLKCVIIGYVLTACFPIHVPWGVGTMNFHQYILSSGTHHADSRYSIKKKNSWSNRINVEVIYYDNIKLIHPDFLKETQTIWKESAQTKCFVVVSVWVRIETQMRSAPIQRYPFHHASLSCHHFSHTTHQ